MTNPTELNKKKQLIAEAAWKMILVHGIEGASVRNISNEARISLGSLRYYFSTQDELLNYSEELAYTRISEKIDAKMNENLPPKEKILGSILELLPDRRGLSVESEVRMAFVIKRRMSSSPTNEKRKETQLLMKTIFSQLALLNLLRKDLSVSMEVERLHSFIEGLSLRDDSAADVTNKALLLYHLNSICVEDFE
ncbi:MAG TPA: TetR family transcriptional regulator [Planococcus sp. (in: firmicutes)]|nr:TetR family transcriptional regulator [Planococcus sp. (in: firmicutes)]